MKRSNRGELTVLRRVLPFRVRNWTHSSISTPSLAHTKSRTHELSIVCSVTPPHAVAHFDGLREGGASRSPDCTPLTATWGPRGHVEIISRRPAAELGGGMDINGGMTDVCSHGPWRLVVTVSGSNRDESESRSSSLADAARPSKPVQARCSHIYHGLCHGSQWP